MHFKPVAFIFILSIFVTRGSYEISLGEDLMTATLEAVTLCEKVYEQISDDIAYRIEGTDTGFIAPEVYMDWNETDSNGYSMLTTYGDESNQAIIAKKDGICYGVFRGRDHWTQNFDARTKDVCDDGMECCKVLTSYFNLYHVGYEDIFVTDLRACAENCTSTNTCVVLTGHSEGGAAATIASIYFEDLKPLTITFGQPPALKGPCALIDSTRVYHWVNSVNVANVRLFDPIPIIAQSKADFVGHALILDQNGSGRNPSVAYMGLDFQMFGSAHVDLTYVAHDREGYRIAITSLLNNANFPINANGFIDGTTCAQTNSICRSNRCDGTCKSKADICGSCSTDADCETGVCRFGGCARVGEFISNGCPCSLGDYCISGRCEFKSWTSFSRICVEKIGNGSFCNEDNDCISGNCSWLYKCSS